jgi:hypothetical protein
MAIIFRPPLYTQRSKARKRSDFDVPNLLLTVLAVAVVAVPFSQEDWPNRKRFGRVGVVDVAPNLLLTTLATPTPTPFKLIDLPSRQRFNKRNIDWNQNLLATTLAPEIVADPLPFVQNNFPTRSIRKVYAQEDVPNLLQTTLAVTVIPFSQNEFLYLRKIGRHSIDFSPNLLQTTLEPVVEVRPFVSFDWNWIRPTQRKQYDVDFLQNLLNTVLDPTIVVTWAEYGAPFMFTAANWTDPNPFFEVYMRATIGTVYARVFDITDGLPVVNSELSTMLGVFQRIRSVELLLTDTHEYKLQVGKLAAHSGEIISGRLIII